MYNDDRRRAVIKDLEKKKLRIVDNVVVLASQGYIINQTKYDEFEWANIILNTFENINILNEEQQRKIEVLYNKFLML